jgi:hypothetical protein
MYCVRDLYLNYRLHWVNLIEKGILKVLNFVT